MVAVKVVFSGIIERKILIIERVTSKFNHIHFDITTNNTNYITILLLYIF